MQFEHGLPPHPGPLFKEKEHLSSASRVVRAAIEYLAAKWFSLSLGERVGVRGKVAIRRVIFAIIAIVSTGNLSAATAQSDETPDLASKLKPVPPFPAAVISAHANKIPVEGIDAIQDGDALNPGDSVTALVTLHEKGTRARQWLIYEEAVAPGPKETADMKPQPMVIYTKSGNKFDFKSSPTMVAVRTFGPFTEAGDKRKLKAEEKSARFPLDKGFLSLGLDRAAASIIRLKGGKLHGLFEFRGTPFSDADVAKGRKLAEDTRTTTDDERALCGACPALLSYCNCAQHTPGLEDIFFKVVETPSVWSVVRHVGISANLTVRTDLFRSADAVAWEPTAGAPVYYFPVALDLNNQPALKLTMVVTAPKPPLLACGGIVGMLAEKPGEKETFLTLRVVSARATKPR
jgi:hypothetical protein